MKRPTVVLAGGLVASVFAYAIVTCAIEMIGPRSGNSSLPAASRPVTRDSREPRSDRESRATMAAMVDSDLRSPQEKLALAASIARLSTSQLREASRQIFDRMENGTVLDQDECIGSLLAQEWAERDPAGAAEWSVAHKGQNLEDIVKTWAVKDPDGLGQKLKQKNPFGDEGSWIAFTACESLVAVGRQDPILFAKLMRSNQGRERDEELQEIIERNAKAALSTPVEIKRVAQALPAEMNFAAPGEPDPPGMFSANMIFEVTARRYQQTDPAGYEAWLATLPEGGRRKAVAAVAQSPE